MAPVLDARNLRRSYGATVALDGIDLTVEAGRIVGLTARTARARAPPCRPSWA